jgi:predicted nuclease of predicted toxin-antitoxin system
METQLKFLADESVEREIVVALRSHFDVTYVTEFMQSAADDAVLRRANDEGRILITLDKDFGELVFRLQQLHGGVILCRVQSLPIREAALLVEETIRKYGESLQTAFTVIQPNNIRIRNK